MPTFEIFSLFALGLLGWLWFDSTHVRSAGIQAVKTACKAEGIQLLDDTVSFASIKFDRDDDGRMVLRRTYSFDFSDTGDNRCRGSLVMRGDTVLIINIGLRLVSNTAELQ